MTSFKPRRRQWDDPANKVFLSYRRSDSGGHTGRIRDRLRFRYGPRAVFHDVDTISAGVDYVDEIRRSLAVVDVQLVVIGPTWLQIEPATGRCRLHESGDLLATEIAIGLTRSDLRVVPVLVGGAQMPAAEHLPASLRDLADRNCVELRDGRWDEDLADLVDKIGGRPYRLAGIPLFLWASLLLTALVASVATLFWPDPPDLMEGDFRIAVAQFTTDDERLEEQAKRLSETVFRGLEAELELLNDEGFDFRLREPSRTGTVRNPSEAADLADSIDADVVVFASLSPDDLRPEFYLRERPHATLSGDTHFAGAEELTGQHDLGARILSSQIATGGIGPSREVVAVLTSRTSALAQFLIGLSYFVDEPRDLDLASHYFEAATVEPGWPDSDGKAVLYHFLGTTEAFRGDYDVAMQRYLHAVEISDGQYARAHLGVAEMIYLLARRGCGSNTADAEGLAAALVAFERAEKIGGHPVSNIDLKAELGMGRVKRCMSQASLADLWQEAEAHLQQVITAYEQGNGRAGPLASEAHAELALLLSPARLDTNAAGAYDDAIAATREAITLAETDKRRISFYNRLGYFLEQSKRSDEAEEAYRTAANLQKELLLDDEDVAPPTKLAAEGGQPSSSDVDEEEATQLEPEPGELDTPPPDTFEEEVAHLIYEGSLDDVVQTEIIRPYLIETEHMAFESNSDATASDTTDTTSTDTAETDTTEPGSPTTATTDTTTTETTDTTSNETTATDTTTTETTGPTTTTTTGNTDTTAETTTTTDATSTTTTDTTTPETTTTDTGTSTSESDGGDG